MPSLQSILWHQWVVRIESTSKRLLARDHGSLALNGLAWPGMESLKPHYFGIREFIEPVKEEKQVVQDDDDDDDDDDGSGEYSES